MQDLISRLKIWRVLRSITTPHLDGDDFRYYFLTAVVVHIGFAFGWYCGPSKNVPSPVHGFGYKIITQNKLFTV